MAETDDFIQCPHEVIRTTCAGVCNCPCDPCAPSRPAATPELHHEEESAHG